MSGIVCLQGGAEFTPGCEEMDAEVLALAPGPRVVVAPYAAAEGREREVASGNAERWYRQLGATDVAVSLDEDGDEDLLAAADLLVLPGGSPARLLDALRPLRNLLANLLDRGAAVSAASAGAMVLCRWTALPGLRLDVTEGLDLVGVDLVLPHYDGQSRWLDQIRAKLPADATVLGLPERSGVLLADGEQRPVGVTPFERVALDAH